MGKTLTVAQFKKDNGGKLDLAAYLAARDAAKLESASRGRGAVSAEAASKRDNEAKAVIARFNSLVCVGELKNCNHFPVGEIVSVTMALSDVSSGNGGFCRAALAQHLRDAYNGGREFPRGVGSGLDLAAIRKALLSPPAGDQASEPSEDKAAQ